MQNKDRDDAADDKATSRPRRREIPAAAVSVRPEEAFKLLGVGKTKGWQLIAIGALEAFYAGRTRLVTMRSIRALAHGDVAQTSQVT